MILSVILIYLPTNIDYFHNDYFFNVSKYTIPKTERFSSFLFSGYVYDFFLKVELFHISFKTFLLIHTSFLVIMKIRDIVKKQIMKRSVKNMADYEKQFTTKAKNTGGRDGKSALTDGRFETPIVPGGSKREGLNPEDLFAMGYSACFNSALDAVKGQENVDGDSIVNAEVTLNQVPNEVDFKLSVAIEVGVEGVDQDKAQDLADKAHKVCPYSRAVENGHIDVEVKAVPYENQ